MFLLKYVHATSICLTWLWKFMTSVSTKSHSLLHFDWLFAITLFLCAGVLTVPPKNSQMVNCLWNVLDPRRELKGGGGGKNKAPHFHFALLSFARLLFPPPWIWHASQGRRSRAVHSCKWTGGSFKRKATKALVCWTGKCLCNNQTRLIFSWVS